MIRPEYNPIVAQEILDDMAGASDQDDFVLTPFEVSCILGMVEKYDSITHDLRKYMDKMGKVHHQG